tara:strand:+ start:11141 stop:11560 length:420 start_codon:yes stop_codon:yes gene_type:complete
MNTPQQRPVIMDAIVTETFRGLSSDVNSYLTEKGLGGAYQAIYSEPTQQSIAMPTISLRNLPEGRDVAVIQPELMGIFDAERSLKALDDKARMATTPEFQEEDDIGVLDEVVRAIEIQGVAVHYEDVLRQAFRRYDGSE